MSAGWTKDSRGTVESYVNPNAHCPVCGATVYFYRSPYNGRVFFDDLGWPWPKHRCTDNFCEPRRAPRDSVSQDVSRPEPAWRLEGWHPLVSSKVHAGGGRTLVIGDFHDEFLEVYIPENESVDPGSPVLVREQAEKPDLFEITFLRSDRFRTQSRKTIAYRIRIAGVGEDIILKAAQGDPAANNTLGQFILWHLDDPTAARRYLERAIEGGIADALIDLAVMELFRRGTRSR